jgi:hypothetical protein
MKKLFLLSTLVLFTTAAFAQGTETKPELKGEVSSSLSALRLASDLVRYGYAQQSALSLIEALQIMNENPTQPLKSERQGDVVNLSNKEGKKSTISLDYNKILADAKEFAADNEVLTKLLAQIEADGQTAGRGAVNGPSRHYDTVNGNSTDTYQVSFIAHYLAEIAVSGDGDTDLDLYVYDSNGNLIAKDEDYSDDCYVSWVPKWTGRFVVKVVNRGRLYNRYVILTN